jgi:ABC-type phosphate transport system substrate-binding protein
MKIYICIWLAIFMASNAWSVEELLAGQAFTDSSKSTNMPQKWQKLPLQYENWAKKADLAITLDQQLYPALLPIIQQYAKNKGLNIMVQEGTCGTSAKGLKDKIVYIAGFCCPPSIADRLPGIKFHTLGIVALALLINPKNPIDNITIEQIRQIFQGNIFRWSDVTSKKRGPRRTIQVLGRLHCKQRPGHWRLLLDNEDLFSPRMTEIGTISDMITEVINDPYAIGYETLWMANQKSLANQIKILAIDSIKPTDNPKLLNGTYPLYRTYNVTTWESDSSKNPKAQNLVKYLIKYMEKLDSQYGFIPVAKLRKAGWQFLENEMIGEPK